MRGSVQPRVVRSIQTSPPVARSIGCGAVCPLAVGVLLAKASFTQPPLSQTMALVLVESNWPTICKYCGSAGVGRSVSVWRAWSPPNPTGVTTSTRSKYGWPLRSRFGTSNRYPLRRLSMWPLSALRCVCCSTIGLTCMP